MQPCVDTITAREPGGAARVQMTHLAFDLAQCRRRGPVSVLPDRMQEGPMISRPTSPYPHNSFRQIAGGALAAILFLAVLVLAILVSYRYAHGWIQVPSGRAETVLPAASDGLAGAISVLGVLVGMVWLCVRQLAS